MHCSNDPRPNEASFAQYAEVVRHARFGTATLELSAGGLCYTRQMPHDVEAHRVAQSIEDQPKGQVLGRGMVVDAHAANSKRFCDTAPFDRHRTIERHYQRNS